MRRNKLTKGVLFLAFLMSSPPQIAFCQTPSDAERAVQLVLKQAANGFYSGTGEKELVSTGDASAVAVAKLFAGKEVTDADVRTILWVVRSSFERPEIVEVADDRQPRAALFLLNSLKHMTTNEKLQADIATTASFLKDQYARYIRQRAAQ